MTIFWPLLIMLTAFGQVNIPRSEFRWLPSDFNQYRGKCYEIGVQAAGDRVSVVAPSRRCKPSQTRIIWVPHRSTLGGKCYLVDAVHGPEGYSQAIQDKKCRPKKIKHQWIHSSTGRSGRCFESGVREDGVEYMKKVKYELCKPDKEEYFYRVKGNKGDCYIFDPLTGGAEFQKKVITRHCRPSNYINVWRQEEGKFEGQCFEMDPETKGKRFINPVPRPQCMKKRKGYFTVVDPYGEKRECVEKAETKEGGEAIYLVNIKNCKSDKNIYIFKFKKPFDGKCYEVDEDTKGQKYIDSVAYKRCRPDMTIYVWVDPEQNLSVHGCFQVDAETGGDKYAQKVKIDKCKNINRPSEWLPRDDGWGGKCIMKLTVGGEEEVQKLKIEKCRPKKVVHLMRHSYDKESQIKGDCWEVDAEKGEWGYSKRVNLKYCKPPFKDMRKFIFRKNQLSPGGQCYEVDKKTEGKVFIQKKAMRNCRDDL